MTDILEVTEAQQAASEAFFWALGGCSCTETASDEAVAAMRDQYNAALATLSDTIKRLERERDYYEKKNTACDKEIDAAIKLGLQPDDTYSSLLTTIATLRSQAKRDAAVVEAAKRQADDPMVGCPFCGHTTQAGHDEDCVLLPALSAREETGQ